ncbi:MAG TPA: YdcF family protein [Ferruginibacter sp.]|jgi:uncharacterized SAM-binding protein YcdF (DUF218 family)|nr:YdcF family protein [Ferruginibacter sp.]
MFFIFSKFLAYFIYPLTWIIVLLLCRLFARSEQRKKNFLIGAIIVFFIFSNVWLASLFAKLWDYPPAQIPADKKYSCAILLGGFGNADDNGGNYFNGSADRFIQAVKLYQEGRVTHILVSGGIGSISQEGQKEGDWAKEQLLKIGVPNEAILVEDNSRSTLENAEFSKKVLDSSFLQPPYVLVTSAFHMRRAAWVFRKEGMNIIPYPCNYIREMGRSNIADILPQIHAMDLWATYIKEIVGYYGYQLELKRLNVK